MKKILRKLIILIVIICILLLIRKNTTRLNTTPPDIALTGIDLTNCTSYFDGCNNCMIQSGQIGGCTRKYCETPTEPKCLAYVDTWATLDLTNCVSYFDGCNNCSVKDGKADACTLMYCETPSEPKCLQYATGTEPTTSDTLNTVQTNDTYTVKTEMGNDIPWQNIYVYDKAGVKVFSLIANGEPSLQFFAGMDGSYLIVDYGTSPDIRSLAVYNIQTQQKLFTSEYCPQNWAKGNGLYAEWNKVFFATLVFSKWRFDGKWQIPQPKILPTCPSDRWEESIGYSELRVYDISTKQVEKTGKLVCSYLQ